MTEDTMGHRTGPAANLSAPPEVRPGSAHSAPFGTIADVAGAQGRTSGASPGRPSANRRASPPLPPVIRSRGPEPARSPGVAALLATGLVGGYLIGAMISARLTASAQHAGNLRPRRRSGVEDTYSGNRPDYS